MSDSPTPLSMERGGKGKTAIPEEKEDEPSLLPMTPERMELMLEEVVDVSFLTSSTDEDSRKALERRDAWAPRFVTAVPSRSKLWPHAPVIRTACTDCTSDAPNIWTRAVAHA